MNMKKILIYALMALCALAACTKAADEPEYKPDTTLHRTGEVTLLASMEDFSTRVEMPGTGHGVWKKNDSLAVFTTDGTPVIFRIEGTGDTRRARFTGTIPSGKKLGSLAVYPYESVVSYEGGALRVNVPSTYDVAGNSFKGVMIASIEDSWEIAFTQLFALMNCSFKQIPANAHVMRITEQGRSLAGNFLVDPEKGVVTGITAPAGTSGLEISFSESPVSFSMTLPLPVAEYKNLVATIYDKAGDEVISSTLTSSGIFFDRAELRNVETEFPKVHVVSDYVSLKGVNWCRGNLISQKDAAEPGFMPGWRLAPTQWYCHNYDKKVLNDGTKDYNYDDNQATAARYIIDKDNCDHFNFGGIANYTSIDLADVAQPVGDKSICGKMYTNAGCTAETTDPAAAVYGDLAFWASNGSLRMPTSEEIATLKQCDLQYGYVIDKATDMKIWGILLTDPVGDTPATNTTAREITDEDMEEGLFLPCAGRHADSNVIVINFRTQADYWSGQAVDKAKLTGESWYSSGAGDNYQYSDFVNYSSNKLSCGHSTGYAYDRRAGFCIRPVKN